MVEALDLIGGQCRSWLVHDDQPSVLGERTHNLDLLLVGGAQPGDAGGGVELELGEFDEFLKTAPHSGPVKERAAARQAAQQDVLLNGHGRDQGHLLRHHRHASLKALVRIAQVALLAGDRDDATVWRVDARDYLGERRLASAVLTD